MKKITEFEYTLWIGGGRKIIETLNPELPQLRINENEDGMTEILIAPKAVEEMDITDYQFFIEELKRAEEAAKKFEDILNQ